MVFQWQLEALAKRVEALELWRSHVDAQVTALTANVATLMTDVSNVLALLQSVQQQLANGIDAADEAAIAAANQNLTAAIGQLAAVIPPGPTGATGATGAAQAKPAT